MLLKLIPIILITILPAKGSAVLFFTHNSYGLLIADKNSVSDVEEFKTTIDNDYENWLITQNKKYLVDSQISKNAPRGVIKILTMSATADKLHPSPDPIEGSIQKTTIPFYPKEEFALNLNDELTKFDTYTKVICNYSNQIDLSIEKEKFKPIFKLLGATIPNTKIHYSPLKITVVRPNTIFVKSFDKIPAEIHTASIPINSSLPIGNFNYPIRFSGLNTYTIPANSKGVDLYLLGIILNNGNPIHAVEAKCVNGFTGSCNSQGQILLVEPSALRSHLVTVQINSSENLSSFCEPAFGVIELIVLSK